MVKLSLGHSLASLLSLVLVLAAWCGSASVAAAALEPETKVPYHLRIVLIIVEHPHFTPQFRLDLMRALKGHLGTSLGKLGTVEVVDLKSIQRNQWEPLWKLVEEKGLEALDSVHELGGGKTHFLRIGYDGQSYDLQARQLDGTSGFVTPIVRKVRLPQQGRAFISHEAALMIGKDFGLVATLDPAGLNQSVFLRIKGSECGPVDHWLKKGEVFAVMQIRQERSRAPRAGAKSPPPSLTSIVSSRVDGVLLKVTAAPSKGVVECKMFYRYEDPLPITGVIGYRCVKLGTMEAPLKLQLTDPSGLPHKKSALQVYARAEAFPDGDKESEKVFNRDGVFESRNKFPHMALVRVMLGDSRISRIPVAILDDRVEVRSVRLDPAAELRDRFNSDKNGLITRIRDGQFMQKNCFDDIVALEKAGKKQDAFNRGEAVLTLLDKSAADWRVEIDRLKSRAAKELPGLKGFLNDGEFQLLALHKKQEELRKYLEEVKTAIAKANDPKEQEKQKKVQDIIRRAELLVTQADYQQALAAYEEALAEVSNEPMIRERIEVPYQTLKKAWALRDGDADHDAARRFIYGTWPKLGALTEMVKHLPDARKAFEKCKAVGDRLSINKMNLASVEVVTRFSDELTKLIEGAKEEADKPVLEKLQKVNEDLQKLLSDIESFMQKK